ncbi:hypothetical protein V5799_023474 [Amblyomma americanum]|uniref:Uncharacterized protein n=1 Tax=Amblyomma americanum TaxID=6943 RepID=A0AAQ4FHI0_AMBAM
MTGGIQVGSSTANVGTQVNMAPHAEAEARDLIDEPMLDEDSSDDYSPLDELESECVDFTALIRAKLFLERTRLTALHYNENCERRQACTTDCVARWNVKYPKRGAAPTACPVKEKPTFGYVQKLMDYVESEAGKQKSRKKQKAPSPIPPPLSSCYPRVAKEDVQNRQSRLNV